MAKSATSYDAIPYRSAAFPQTRPERLEAIARLFGLVSPPAATARVLELGCGAGANLISLAHDYPQTQCIGLDASARQIADGWAVLDALGLKNLQLKHLDISEFDRELGEFDYIICHGVFSWVPPTVQNKILDILRQHLAPNGVGYVSYNTYPGWHIRGIVRDMMRYHGNQFTDPTTQLLQAKALVQFVADTGKIQDSRYKQLLRDELEILSNADDSYLHHEHLEENNQPFYIHEFAQKLGTHGLQFLGEADFSTMVASNFAPEIADTLRRIGAHDILQMEQYMDYVRCRYFRQTLICRRNVTLNRMLEPKQVRDFWFAANASPVRGAIDYSTEVTEEFKVPSGAGLNCRHPLTKAAFAVLQQHWPASMAFPTVLAEAQQMARQNGVTGDVISDENFLAADLLAGMAAGLIEWRVTPPPFPTSVSEQPIGSRLAQYQAQASYQVTNGRAEVVTLDWLHAEVLALLDGTRKPTDLLEPLVNRLQQSGQTLQRGSDQSPITDPDEIRTTLEAILPSVLRNLARAALLIP